ncbi:unnamed protein product [Prorocentrum cordatum]|uniref:SH3 domain-containing protein n=1 Tax=Prorocentrum cordatum TaxID=2364126 RepID=A0ABN9X8W0_9DINO|nr:unnamed protein product [Polarella glacialis]
MFDCSTSIGDPFAAAAGAPPAIFSAAPSGAEIDTDSPNSVFDEASHDVVSFVPADSSSDFASDAVPLNSSEGARWPAQARKAGGGKGGSGPELSGELDRVSRELSQLLRHRGVDGMDADGFAPLTAVIDNMRCRPSPEQVEMVVSISMRADGAARFQLRQDAGSSSRRVTSGADRKCVPTEFQGEMVEEDEDHGVSKMNFDHSSYGDEYISLRAGSPLVQHRSRPEESGWAYGRSDGRQGWFPAVAFAPMVKDLTDANCRLGRLEAELSEERGGAAPRSSGRSRTCANGSRPQAAPRSSPWTSDPCRPDSGAAKRGVVHAAQIAWGWIGWCRRIAMHRWAHRRCGARLQAAGGRGWAFRAPRWNVRPRARAIPRGRH